jgi:hypothetical protein
MVSVHRKYEKLLFLVQTGPTRACLRPLSPWLNNFVGPKILMRRNSAPVHYIAYRSHYDMVNTAVLKKPLRTKAIFGPEPVLPSGTQIIVTSEQSIIPPGMRCVIILVDGRSHMVFPSELQWATGLRLPDGSN